MAPLTFTGTEGGDTGEGGTAVTALGGGLHGSAHATGCHEMHTVSPDADNFCGSSLAGLSTLTRVRRLSPGRRYESLLQTAVTSLHQRRASRLDQSPSYRFAQTVVAPKQHRLQRSLSNNNRSPNFRSTPKLSSAGPAPPSQLPCDPLPPSQHPSSFLSLCHPVRAKLTASFLMW